MRFKVGGLFVLISCLGAAFAMAVSKQDDSATSGVVSAFDKKITPTTVAEQHEQPDTRFDLAAIKRPVPENLPSDGLFQSKTWYTPPPQTPVSSLPPPPSSAPPLSFTFVGRMIDGNDVILFLSQNGRQYTVKTNDVLENTYRLDKITDNNAVLTYLPMNIQQTLAFNSTAVGSLSLSTPVSTRQLTDQSHINPVP